MFARTVVLSSLLASLTACGAGGPDLVGTWSYTAGTSTLDCGGGDSETNALSGNVTFTEGVGADLVLVDDGCNVEFDATDDGAEVRPGQSCSISGSLADGTPVTVTMTPITWTFTASDDGDSLVETGAASVVFQYPDQAVTCSYTAMGTLQLVGR